MNQTLISPNSALDFVRPSKVLFDLDGTLINTVPIVLESFRLACLEVTGINLSEEAMVPLLGMNDADTQEHFARKYDDDGFPYLVIRERQRRIQVELFSAGIPLMPGALESLEALKARGIPYGVHTGSTREEAQYKLAKSGLEREVRYYVAGDDVRNGKPAPDILLKLLDLLTETATDGLVVGDTQNDIIAGKSAGMKTAHVSDRLANEIILSDYSFSSLRDFAANFK